MRKTKKNLLSVLGVMSLIFGIAVLFPSYSNSNYLGLGASFILILIGLVALSFVFGD